MKTAIIDNLYSIYHQGFATDRYTGRLTLVIAQSPEEAMKSFNSYLETKPDGVYTALPCENIKHVNLVKAYIEKDAEFTLLRTRRPYNPCCRFCGSSDFSILNEDDKGEHLIDCHNCDEISNAIASTTL